jgi:hypothetical protein
MAGAPVGRAARQAVVADWLSSGIGAIAARKLAAEVASVMRSPVGEKRLPARVVEQITVRGGSAPDLPGAS